MGSMTYTKLQSDFSLMSVMTLEGVGLYTQSGAHLVGT